MENPNQTPEPAEQVEVIETPNAEAAKRRVQLRATEAERDQLAAQLHGERVGMIDAFLEQDETWYLSAFASEKEEGVKLTPAAFWAAGITVADCLTNDKLDKAKIKANARKVKNMFFAKSLKRKADDGEVLNVTPRSKRKAKSMPVDYDLAFSKREPGDGPIVPIEQ